MPGQRTYNSPFDDLVGLRMISASGEQVVAEVTLSERHHQPNGIVHGGVYATVVETTASVGASLWLGEGRAAVGLSNHTDFLRSLSEGVLRIVAEPIQQGRTMQLWRVEVSDEQSRPVASGRVRLMNLPAESA